MTQRIAYYQVMIGLPGYMPDSHEFRAWETRRELTQGINEILEFYGFSQRNRRQISVAEIWRYIQSGGRKGHFTIRGNMGNPNIAEFIQIDSAEYHRALKESDSY